MEKWRGVSWASKCHQKKTYKSKKDIVLKQYPFLIYRSDIILLENEQWLPEIPYVTNISLKGSHLTSIGLKVGCLGGRTDDTDNIDNEIEQFSKRITARHQTDLKSS